jgi:oligopeptide/dipeptide ABC transporter ATP-binding protein
MAIETSHEALQARSGAPVLSVRDLSVRFYVDGEWFPAAEHVSYDVHPGEVLAIVGESGSGKTQASMALIGLLPPNGRATGSVMLGDRQLMGMPTSKIRHIRGREIAVIFQEPMTALNPVFTVGSQMMEVFRVHRNMGRADALENAVEMLATVGVPAPERRIREYPYQLSGGMRQRVMIAMALACRPALLLADEPTTALDVSIQAQILELMAELKAELNTAILLITHDLGVVAEVTRRVAVMYTGRIMEEAPTLDLFDTPLHPYTRGLLTSIPRADASFEIESLTEIKGVVPSVAALPPGCHFEPRCPVAVDICRAQAPALEEARPGHRVACWRAAHA